jgi:hypothetical protein
MIVCTSCKHEEYYGTLFCSECGVELAYLNLELPKTVVYGNTPKPKSSPFTVPEPIYKPPSKPLPDTRVSLKVLDTGAIIPLEGGLELALGRISGNQPILPDIDLTPYQAFEGGVSRLHATIKIEKTEIILTDLGSANGTRVNGKKIVPHSTLTLENGDILTLGRFKVQVLIHL